MEITLFLYYFKTVVEEDVSKGVFINKDSFDIHKIQPRISYGSKVLRRTLLRIWNICRCTFVIFDVLMCWDLFFLNLLTNTSTYPFYACIIYSYWRRTNVVNTVCSLIAIQCLRLASYLEWYKLINLKTLVYTYLFAYLNLKLLNQRKLPDNQLALHFRLWH